LHPILSHGVMVTLRFLVSSFKVRVLVGQLIQTLNKLVNSELRVFCFMFGQTFGQTLKVVVFLKTPDRAFLYLGN
jgi:hypothetical protein